MRDEQPMRLSLVAMDTLDEFAALMYIPYWWKWRLDTIPYLWNGFNMDAEGSGLRLPR